mmetsp:Transcript_12524/g.18256  ORF Transcript_12524/g.18256 Transcript_12524/m.18256 type:complete len:237 (+) Transcript_12524:673-1383(+)
MSAGESTEEEVLEPFHQPNAINHSEYDRSIFVPEPVWERTDRRCFGNGERTDRRCSGDEDLVSQLQIPSSSSDSIIAPGNFSSMRSSVTVWCGNQKEVPMLKSPPSYLVHWIEDSSLATRVTKDELQTFCDEAAEYCKEEIHAPVCCTRAFYILIIILVLLIVVSILIGVPTIVPFLFIGFAIYYCVFKNAIPCLLQSIQNKLHAFINSKKEQLFSKGIKPLPGPYGTYIQFKSLI